MINSPLRQIFRVPMGIFDVYAGLPKRFPQVMNYYVFMGAIFFVMVAGAGAEKITLKQYRSN